ncbi:MAG: ParB/RepB/Spo0J family partition protein [Clostridiales bacterium]|nr:ParB/RepB/Spo0J family partition protein [Clostridiales bacterium]
MRGLAESLRQNGLLQPISVRKNGAGYELIAGERRLRAAKLLGWRSIAAIVNECDAGQSAVLAMTENMQRQNLGVFEEAEGLRRLIERWGVTQEEAALRLGKSQSALANKLRLLKLRDSERDAINRAGLTERHARALLRICDEKQREHALGVIIEKGWNVAKSEEYIDRLLQGEAAKPKKKRPTMVVKDVRIFMNTLRHAVDTMKKSGIAAQSRQNETEEYIEYMVRIPKAAAEAARLPAGSPISTFPVKRTG